MSLTDRPPPLPPASLLKAARRLMRPLIRLMMRCGLTFPVLAEDLRRLFVDVAATEILTDPKSCTDSRISLLTGVHRKEIKRLRELAPDAFHAPRIVTLASQIIARWIGSAPFSGLDGKPLPLPRIAAGARPTGPSFDSLVESVTTDIRPRTVLEDLLSYGAVFIDPQDCVQLNAAAFIPHPQGEEQLFYFSRNLHDHVAAAVANISVTQTPPFLDRSVHYDRLTSAQVKELTAYAREMAMHALLEVNRKALELTSGELTSGELTSGEAGNDDTATRRINFGVYVFDEAEPPGTEVSA